jgi:transcriptional regulator with XRE-family HTH domain
MRQTKDFISYPALAAFTRLGERIRIARKARKLTLSQLEQKTRIHRTTLGRLERGDVGVSLGVFLSVLEALNQLSDAELILSKPELLQHRRVSSPPVLDQDF